ncbi:MAG TPA: glycine cleavage system aminomethyltransferase GcvT [Gemmataceae bacterium]|jgi:aminomethyltransferase|nr:glycine cleavage system aminomethyltransferase GcvT [Gemmataceae bacterium]
MANLRTPLYDWHLAHRARMVPFGGWDMPVQYVGVMHEHKAVRSGAGLFDVSHMARLNFAGTQALDLIQKVWTNNAATMKDFQVRYGLVCNEAGGCLDDILVYRWPYGWAMVVNASNREKIVGWLNEHKGSIDVQIEDQTTETAMLAVQGPKAVATCAGMFEADASTLKYYFALPTKYKGKNCVVSRTGYTGEDGLEIMVSKSQAVELADDLVNRGAEPCGLGCRDTLRLEAAMPLYGHELNETINPIQAGLGWAVKVDKGPFVGHDALATAIEDVGKVPQRVGLELEGKRAAREGCQILVGNSPMGIVTSGSYAPWLEKSIAMGYVTANVAAVGTNLMVDIRGSLTPAKVVALPFYQRAK